MRPSHDATKAQPDRKLDAGAPSRAFPGQITPGLAPDLRVAMARAPLAALLAHASEFPEVEVCGVLVGAFAEDEQGVWLDIQAAIRGEGAREKGAAVTFTNEAWNHIHSELDEKHPGRVIVGWYHTHPNFGVFLSEMDAFIHNHFFSHPCHIALVRDPVQGETAIFHKRDGDLAPLPAYWVDGLPTPLAKGLEPSAVGDLQQVLQELRSLHAAVARMAAERESQQGSLVSWLILTFMVALVGALAFHEYQDYRAARQSQAALERFAGSGRILVVPAMPEGPAAPAAPGKEPGPAPEKKP